MRSRLLLTIAAGALLASASAFATPFQVIRIGDVDGFGYGTGAGYVGANGSAANADGLGVLAAGDLLPDLNRGGSTLTGGGDDFDNRIGGEGVSVLGAVNQGTVGVEFTDISLSTSYDASSAANNVWNHNTGTRGPGGLFPASPSNSVNQNPSESNQPGFEFRFFVADGDIDTTAEVFFNLVFGDYDVSPASVALSKVGGGQPQTIALNLQPGNKDGLIQEASVTLQFGDVFQATTGGYNGYLGVDFVAPNEPYTAFDYVELSVNSDPGSVPTPTPDNGSTLAMFGLAMLALLPWARKVRRTA